MIAAVFAESHKMAFHDSLTGIPGRQALVADLKKLSGRYSIAMADVDHFKKFNDSYGHDVGDQVLRMVASHLSVVGGGGKAYRYGGEEFTIVFASLTVEEAESHLEAVRKKIADTDFFIRDKDRPDNDDTAKKLRQKKSPAKAKAVRVTISLGVVEKSRADNDPVDAIKRADEALYKAKETGRNRVVSA